MIECSWGSLRVRGDRKNRLVFNLDVGMDAVGKTPVFKLSWNRGWTIVDGMDYLDLFSGTERDFSENSDFLSDCLKDFLNEESEPTDDAPTSGGGDGSYDEPFTGTSIVSAQIFDLCTFTRKLKTCKTTEDEETTCRYTTFSWVSKCGNVSP